MTLLFYLTRQILGVMASVTVILLVVGLMNRFIQYLGQAVAGEMASDVLLQLIFYRLPDFLLVILPLALFLGIILVYGRMYAENEMTVLSASGLSRRRLLGNTMASAVVVAGLVSLLSLVLAPWGIRNTEQLKQAQDQLTEIDLIGAGQFQAFDEGGRVTYAERIRSESGGRILENVFVVLNQDAGQDGAGIRIIVSNSARSVIDPATGARFMRLEEVMEYAGNPGAADYTIGQFDVQGIVLPEPTSIEELDETKALFTSELLGSALPERQAELQWRVSAVLLIPIVALIAVPLSRVDPRQGRYGKLVPAALLYAVYYILLQVSRDMLADGELPAAAGLWWVHALFLLIGWFFYNDLHLRARARGRL